MTKQKQEYVIEILSTPNKRRITSFGVEHHPKNDEIHVEKSDIARRKKGRSPAPWTTGRSSAPFYDLKIH